MEAFLPKVRKIITAEEKAKQLAEELYKEDFHRRTVGESLIQSNLLVAESKVPRPKTPKK